jgi:hypothetical protein
MRSVLQRPSQATPRRRLRAGTLLSAGVVAVLVASLAGAAAAAPTAATKASGDPTVVSDWNEIAVTTLAGDTTKGVETFLYMGFVQAAVYDAVVGVEGRFEPYSFHARARRGTSVQAAAVAAAYKVLVTYVPAAQATLDERYAASLAQLSDGPAKDRGIAFGTRAAEHLIRLRANDGRNAPIQFTQPPAPGVWRPTPPAFLPMAAPWLGFVTPLLARSATQFAPPPPPALTSARYTRDFNEVKALGSATSTERTAAQTDTARFFSGNGLVQYNAALRDQVTVRDLDIVEAARMFAAVDMNVADGVISVWYAKYVYGYWRPITAINLADTDGNPATVADPTWTPLFATPAYPEYPSGYNVVNSAVTHSLENLFHTRHLRLTLITTVPGGGGERFYDSGRVLRRDVVNARMWNGFHFRFANTAARDIGRRLARWTIDHYFQPIHKHEKG